MNSAIVLLTAGWVGVVAQLGAYALVSRGSLSGASARYHSANVCGAALMVASATAMGNWAVVAGQLVWLGLGAAALARLAPVRPHRVATALPEPPDPDHDHEAQPSVARRAHEPGTAQPVSAAG